MADENTLKAPNPWHPTTDVLDLKILGKLAEELGEAVAAVSRCVIQGIGESEPVTGKPNKDWLEDELADVTANILLAVERFGLDEERIKQRILKKLAHLRRWHAL